MSLLGRKKKSLFSGGSRSTSTGKNGQIQIESGGVQKIGKDQKDLQREWFPMMKLKLLSKSEEQRNVWRTMTRTMRAKAVLMQDLYYNPWAIAVWHNAQPRQPLSSVSHPIHQSCKCRLTPRPRQYSPERCW